MRQSATIILPMPPSVNAAYAHKLTRSKKTGALIARRFPSKKLEAWKKEAGKELIIQRPRKFTGPVDVEINVRRTARQRSSDIDGRLKATLDLLVECHVIKDDSLVHSVRGIWTPAEAGAACLVIISEAA